MIRATEVVALVGLATMLSARAAEPAASVRYDGFYVAPSRGCTDYFRFYPDGTLVHACAMATPRQAARWLRKGYSPFGDAWGTYRITGDRIIARVSAHRGEPGHTGIVWLEYRGRIRGETMVLRVQYRKNNYDETLRYKFMKMRLPPDRRNQAMQLTASKLRIHLVRACHPRLSCRRELHRARGS